MENVSSKLKTASKIIGVVSAILAIILGIIQMKLSFITGLIYIVVGCFVAWFEAVSIYAYAELLENTERIKYRADQLEYGIDRLEKKQDALRTIVQGISDSVTELEKANKNNTDKVSEGNK